MTQRIEVIVSPTGEAHLETRGFAGADCQQASQFLQAALGRMTAERLTGEFFQSPAALRQIEEQQ